jgi:hypothetical protein
VAAEGAPPASRARTTSPLREVIDAMREVALALKVPACGGACSVANQHRFAGEHRLEVGRIMVSV